MLCSHVQRIDIAGVGLEVAHLQDIQPYLWELKVACSSEFWRSTNFDSKLIEFFVFVNFNLNGSMEKGDNRFWWPKRSKVNETFSLSSKLLWVKFNSWICVLLKFSLVIFLDTNSLLLAFDLLGLSKAVMPFFHWALHVLIAYHTILSCETMGESRLTVRTTDQSKARRIGGGTRFFSTHKLTSHATCVACLGSEFFLGHFSGELTRLFEYSYIWAQFLYMNIHILIMRDYTLYTVGRIVCMVFWSCLWCNG